MGIPERVRMEEMDLQMIGEGNTAEIYAWQEGRILKLFRKGFSRGGIEKEYRVSKEVERLGLPIPRVGELMEYHGRTGIVYERIDGESLLKLVSTKPWIAGRAAKQLAKIQYGMHQYKAEGLASYKEELEWNINHAGALSEEEKQTILRYLDRLPQGTSLCHGDFHPGNIIKTADGYIVLDWMTAASGSPGIDVARTVLLLKDAQMPGNIPGPARRVIDRVRHRMARIYLKSYYKLSGLSPEEINQWRLPVLAARLTEWIPETEKDALRKEIDLLLQ